MHTTTNMREKQWYALGTILLFLAVFFYTAERTNRKEANNYNTEYLKTFYTEPTSANTLFYEHALLASEIRSYMCLCIWIISLGLGAACFYCGYLERKG